jgi:hypothetical protein
MSNAVFVFRIRLWLVNSALTVEVDLEAMFGLLCSRPRNEERHGPSLLGQASRLRDLPQVDECLFPGRFQLSGRAERRWKRNLLGNVSKREIGFSHQACIDSTHGLVNIISEAPKLQRVVRGLKKHRAGRTPQVRGSSNLDLQMIE